MMILSIIACLIFFFIFCVLATIATCLDKIYKALNTIAAALIERNNLIYEVKKEQDEFHRTFGAHMGKVGEN
jgi:hypothetical protein